MIEQHFKDLSEQEAILSSCITHVLS